MEKIVSWAKRRGFIYPGSDIYGGLANSWDYGPMGVELKNNIRNEWWKRFVLEKDNIVGLDAALIMNPKVWQASGHIDGFSDPLVEDKKTHERYRLDHLLEDNGVNISGMSLEDMAEKTKELNLKSPKGNELTEPKMFNLMFETYMGPVKSEEDKAYLRPETAQAIFVNFKNVLDTTRMKVPFGIAQVGRAFRNEITTGNFIFRMREFDQMEIEFFVAEKDWKKYFDYWLSELHQWLEHLGINKKNLFDYETPEAELAHYSKRTVDIEYEFPFGRKELYGLAYRTDYDLKKHMEKSGEKLFYTDPQTKEKFVPHVIEPSLGLDRTILAVLNEAYTEEDVDGSTRTVAKFPYWMAPVKVAVFPLLGNNEQLTKKAKDVYESISSIWHSKYDESGAIGKRYRRHDEIGTPVCITIDHDSLEDDTITLRNRDSMEQIRVPADDIVSVLQKIFNGEKFNSLGE